MPAAEVILQLKSQVAPQLAATANAYKAVASETAKAEQGALRYATAVQKLTLAQARVATESQRYAVQTANVAKAQAQAELAALRLANAQDKAARSASYAAQTADAIKSSLLGVVGPAALVATALAGAAAVANSFKEAFSFSAQMQQTTASIAIQLRGVRDSGQAFAQAAAFGDQYRYTQEQTTAAVSASVGVLRKSSAAVGDVLGVFARLQILSPEQSLQDAALAVKELQSGDITSLSKRFEISRDSANKMKAEIKGGSDAIVVLGNYLDSVGVGMDVLKIRSEGAAGAINNAAIAAERLKLAQGKLAEGPGSVVTNVQADVSNVAAWSLGSDSKALAEFAASLMQNYGAASKFLNVLGVVIPTVAGHTFVAQQATAATLRSADADDRAAASSRNLGQVISQETKDKLDSQIASAGLAQEQARLTADSNRAAQGLLGAGDQALLLAQKYGIASDQARFLIQQQQALSNATALANQRVGERDPSNTQTADQFNKFDKLADAGRADQAAKDKTAREKAAQEAKQLADANDALRLSRAKTSGAKIAELQRQQAATADPVEKIKLQTQIEQERNSAAKSHTSELNKQLKLTESTYDSIAKQRDALLDIEELGIRDRQQDRADVQKIKTANAILNSPNASADMKARAQDALDLISVQDRKRAAELASKGTTAGATIIGGKLYQSQPGGALPPPPGATTGGGLPSAPGGAPSAAGGAGGSLTINLVADGKTLASITEPYIWDAMMAAIRGGSLTIGG